VSHVQWINAHLLLSGYFMDSRHHDDVFWQRWSRGGRRKRPDDRQLRVTEHAAAAPFSAAFRGLPSTVDTRPRSASVAVRPVRVLPLRGRSAATNSPVLLGRRREAGRVDADGRDAGNAAERRPIHAAGTHAGQLVWSGVSRPTCQ